MQVLVSVMDREVKSKSTPMDPVDGKLEKSSVEWVDLLPGFRYKVEVYPRVQSILSGIAW
jgi:hypothetical protein